MAKSKLTVERVKERVKGGSALYLVKLNGRIVGLLEKYRDTRTTRHPWKAWLGYGMAATYLGAYYQPTAGWPVPAGAAGGGRAAALAAVEALATAGVA